MNQNTANLYTSCTLCPRACGVDRTAGQRGVCGESGRVRLARAALHMWEEPCISGKNGSGAVFFVGCPLRCVYCQNDKISGTERGADSRNGNEKIHMSGTKGVADSTGETARNENSVACGESDTAGVGKIVSVERLAEIFLELQAQGAENINLVTPTHFTPSIVQAVRLAHRLSIPVVYNCGGYERVETLRLLEGIVDIYLTDFKYMDETLAARCSHAADYPYAAKEALREMVRQQPQPLFDARGMMQKGVIVRHLLLPGHVKNAEAVTEYVYRTYGNQVYLSLMNQYTPMQAVLLQKQAQSKALSSAHERQKVKQSKQTPPDFVLSELTRRVTKREYERLISYACGLGVENAFIQEGKTAQESFIPAFDGEGIF